ncbi:MAG: hypothetical protein VKJ04_02905 [Vampirovibrionales bacterium]|nr:hypothetical protein [Vampirovibrionales bacterium]
MQGPLPPGVVIIGIFLILLLLPIKLDSDRLKRLAFLIWVAGGIAMSYNGLVRLENANLDTLWLIVAIVLSAVIGIAKGKFVLGKTSAKNVERLDALTEPQRPLAVYSVRSWIIISLMVLIAVGLNVFNAPDLIRGCISLGIGLALIVSSLRYIQKPSPTLTP